MNYDETAAALGGYPDWIKQALLAHARLLKARRRGSKVHYQRLYMALAFLNLTLSPKEQDALARTVAERA